MENRIEELLNSASEKWLEALTEKEQEAINDYSCNAYKEINGILRNKELYERNDWEEKIEFIDSALDKFELIENILVFRYETRDLKFQDDLFKLLQTQKQIFYSNFCSTSISETYIDTLIKYAQASKTKLTILKIKALIPKGFKCAYIRFLSEFPEEKEVLIARNVYLNIYSIDKNDNIICIKGKIEKGED